MICLMPMCAYLSETSRMVEIYKALRSAGAETVIATHGGTHEALLRSEGIPYEIIAPHMSAERCQRFVQEAVGMGHVGQSMYGADEMRTHVLAEAAFFRDRGANAVVTGFTLTALLSSRLAGIPVITDHAGSFIPPLFERNMLPAASKPPSRVFEFLPRPLSRWLQNKGFAYTKFYLSGFNALAAELGVEAIPSFPALLLGDLTLVTEAPEVYGISEAEMRAWRPGSAYRPSTRFEYTGPIFAELDLLVPDTVSEALDGAGPLIYVALTSSTPELVRTVVGELAKLDARMIVAGTVHLLDDLTSDNVIVAGVLPSHKIMPRVDLAVTAGGQGSVQCAMAAGVPLIGVPLQPEQDANLHFLALQGAAAALPVSDIGRGKLAPLARRMLADASARQAARRIRDIYAERDGPRLSAKAILEFVGGKTSGQLTASTERTEAAPAN